MRSMPTNAPVLRFDDIVENIDRLRRHTDGMSETDFINDAKTIDATERCLERIAEAARKLGDAYDQTYPNLALPQLRKFGSILRHDYDTIQPVLLWRFVQDRLDGLEEMARVELANFTDN
jgi:uncharacterized protein with HEPN domain